MRKGFTLVEVLGVIVILSVLLSLCFPVVTNIIKNGKEAAYNNLVADIQKAASDWSLQHSQLLPEENNSLTIKLGSLKQEGLINKKIKNPKTGKFVSNESTITISYEKGSYVYDVNVIDIEMNQSLPEGPILVLQGEIVQYFEVNQNGLKYTDLGCKAYNDNNEEINVSSTIFDSDNNVVSSIDEKNISTYKILYEAEENGKVSSLTRIIIINDTTSPEIDFYRIEVNLADYTPSLLDEGVTVTDNSGEEIQATHDNTVKNSIGTYYVTYTAKDSNDNTFSKRRTVILK